MEKQVTGLESIDLIGSNCREVEGFPSLKQVDVSVAAIANRLVGQPVMMSALLIEVAHILDREEAVRRVLWQQSFAEVMTGHGWEALDFLREARRSAKA